MQFTKMNGAGNSFIILDGIRGALDTARLPELARAHGAQIILLAGDLLDSASPYPETAKALAETFAGCGAEVFLAPGNHDYYSAGAPYARLTFPENVHIFRTQRIEAVTLPELGVRVWGAAFTDSRCPGLLRGFSVPKQAGLLDVLCVHGEVGNPASAYNPVSAAELAASGLDYAAFGHVHRFGGVQRAGATAYAYPGCLPGRGFDETGDKGFLFGEVTEKGADLDFIPFARRRYLSVTADITDRDPAETVRRALGPGCGGDVCRVLLTGARREDFSLRALEEELTGLCAELTFSDETYPEEDIWARCGEDSLRGLFLQELRGRYDEASEEEKKEILLAVRFGLAALDNRD